MISLVLPVPYLRSLRARAGGGDVLLPVAPHDGRTGRRWLARSPPGTTSASPLGAHFRFSPRPREESAAPNLAPGQLVGRVFLEQPWRTAVPRLSGVAIGDQGEELLSAIELPGAGMHALGAHGALDAPTTSERRREREERWSRTIGALGGPAIWRRLTRLRIAIVGCGRLGSLLAAAFGRLGVSAEITLIDPDVMEAHNVGEMDLVGPDDVGAPKGEAVARRLNALDSDLHVFAVARSLLQPAALAIARDADVICTCPDADYPRLVGAMMATLYHRVLLDVGTGVRRAAGVTDAGADVRLIVPTDGCLLCRGGLADFDGAIADLTQVRPIRSVPWHATRAGSLRHLNQIAVGIATGMLQDLVASRIERTTWAHVDAGVGGRINVSYPEFQTGGACALCARAGWGDEE
jgi:hypothetical protein